MSEKYAINGDNAYFINGNQIVDRLPVGVYEVNEGMSGPFFSVSKLDLSVEEKLFGDVKENSIRVLNTFNRLNGRNVGVLLSGEKGSGKTLLAKKIIFDAARLGIPTIIVASATNPVLIQKMVGAISSPCVVFFDEFDKNFRGEEEQGPLLSLFDGLSKNKVFIVALNKLHTLNENFLNRPGRFLYHFRHSLLSEKTLRDLCEHYEMSTEFTDNLVNFGSGSLNFDCARALIEESIRYNQSPKELLDFLNIEPQKPGRLVNATISCNGVTVQYPNVRYEEAYDGDTIIYLTGKAADTELEGKLPFRPQKFIASQPGVFVNGGYAYNGSIERWDNDLDDDVTHTATAHVVTLLGPGFVTFGFQ